MESRSPMLRVDLENYVHAILSSTHTGCTSTNIVDLLFSSHNITPDKLAVNRVLYSMKEAAKVKCNTDTPPVWQIVQTASDAEVADVEVADVEAAFPPPLTHCIVDLGNTHDCLQNLLPYAARGLLTVSAYADMAFRGYGISPSVSADNVRVYQSDTPDKNSADVQIVWDICRLVEKLERENSARRCHIYIATKDMGFMRVKGLVERNRLHSVTFVTNWQALRMHIE